MQEIIDKYDTIGSSYLLPIILDAKTDEIETIQEMQPSW